MKQLSITLLSVLIVTSATICHAMADCTALDDKPKSNLYEFLNAEFDRENGRYLFCRQMKSNKIDERFVRSNNNDKIIIVDEEGNLLPQEKHQINYENLMLDENDNNCMSNKANKAKSVEAHNFTIIAIAAVSRLMTVEVQQPEVRLEPPTIVKMPELNNRQHKEDLSPSLKQKVICPKLQKHGGYKKNPCHQPRKGNH